MRRKGLEHKDHKKQKNKKELWLIIGIFVLALLVRGLYLLESRDNPTFDTPVVDSLTYDQMARQFNETGQLTYEFFWQPIFYPMFLSFVYWLSDGSILFVKILQVIIGAFTCVLIYFLGKKIFNKTAGGIAAVIAALYMPLVFFEAELLAVGWACFWTVVLLLLFLKAREKPSFWICLLLGLTGVLSIITRPVFLPFYLIGCVWLLVSLIFRKINISRYVIEFSGIVLGFSLIAIPVSYLSFKTVGIPTIVPCSGGINFYIGNNKDYKETITIRPGVKWKQLTEEPVQYGAVTYSQKQKYFYDKAKDYLFSQPLSFFKGIAHKGIQFISSREIPRNVDIYLFRPWSNLLKIGVWKIANFGFPFGLLLPIALVGGVFQRHRIPGIVWLFLIFYSAAVIMVFVSARYRMPMVPVLCVLVAGGITYCRNMLRARQFKILVLGMIFFIAVIFLGSGFDPYFQENLNYKAELYYGLGDSYEKHNRLKKAIDAYKKAISFKANYLEAHHNVGILLAEKGQFRQAFDHFNQAIRIDAENAKVHEDYGLALVDAGMIQEAIDHYKQSVNLRPDNSSAYDHLGTAYFKLNQLPEALDNYTKALELATDDPVINNNIGNIYAITGRYQQAVAYYEKSLALSPKDAETLNNIANALSALGKFEEATVRYRESLSIEPHNAGTHFNLGLCLKTQNFLKQAAKEFSKAIEIAPNYVKALHHLAMTLSEMGECHRAVEQYENALKLEPENIVLHAELAHIYIQLGNIEEAKQHYSKTVDINPNNPAAITNLGNALALNGEYTEAAAKYRKSLAIDRYQVNTLNNLGNVLMKLGLLKQAEQQYNNSLMINTDNPGTHYALGLCLEKQNRFEEAKVSYEIALEVDPTYEKAKLALKKLEENQTEQLNK